MAENINIGGRLHSTATGNVVTGADEILYEPVGGTPKKQSVVNQETGERVSTLETAVGTGGSVDERIATEGAKHYLKSETYNQSELNSMITTPNQEYVTLIAESGDTLSDIFDGITGAADTTYRVGNWDGSANSGAGGYDITKYSEYAYNGTNFVHLSTKSQIGEVFDISAYHATGGTLETYEDLEDALTGTNGGVPQSLQKGGMSVKFVQSSDNKYVQYRLMAQSFTTDVMAWQNVDTALLNKKVFGEITKDVIWGNGVIAANGQIYTSSLSKFTQPFLLRKGEGVTVGTRNTNITIIGSSTSSELSVGDSITPIQRTSATDQFETYTYTAKEDIKIVLCVNASDYSLSFYDSNNLTQKLDSLGNTIQQVVEHDKNNALDVLNNANSRKYNESGFQSGYISPTTGKNVYDNTYIRTEALLKANDSFYLLTSENIKGFIYYYSEYNLNSFTKRIELISGEAYYIPAATYYRLAFCYNDYSTPVISDIVDKVQQLRLNTTDIDINHSKNIVQYSKLSQYDISGFQLGNISKTDGQNILGNSYIRTIALLIAKKDFYLIISNDNIGGVIYYYSDFALNSYTEAVELKSNVAYYIPVDTYYRLVFYYKNLNTPVISSILDNVKQLQYKEPNIGKLQAVTNKMLDASLFQSGSISTEDGTNVATNYSVRTTGLLKANETYLISLPENIIGRIYYYSEHLLTSYTGYVDLLPNSLNYIGKGTEYRLVFSYTDYQYKPQPVVADIIGEISKTYNIIDRIESIDLNTDKSSWVAGGIAVDTGESVTEQYNKRIRVRNIKSTEYSIWATGCYKVSVYVYNGESYLGCLNDNNTLSKETIKWWSKVDLNEFASKNPQYTLSIVACRSDSNGNPIEDVMTAAEGENIKMLSPFEMKLFVKDTFCPIVSFIDDDIPDEAMENWYSIGNDTGIRCGFAVPTASISEDRWNQIKRLQSDGFDFLSHTHNHINLMNTDPEVIAADLQLSVEAFTNHGIKVNALVYPQSSINDAALTVLKKYFEYSFNGGRGLSSIQGNPLRQHNITRSDTVESALTPYTDPNDGVTYQVHAMLPLSDLKACVDKAVEENCWVIFESHFRNSRTADPNTNDGFYFTPEMRQNVIELIRYAVSKGCKVLTPSEGYEILKNRLKRGTYGGGSYYIVDHNGFVYRKNM